MERGQRDSSLIWEGWARYEGVAFHIVEQSGHGSSLDVAIVADGRSESFAKYPNNAFIVPIEFLNCRMGVVLEGIDGCTFRGRPIAGPALNTCRVEDVGCHHHYPFQNMMGSTTG